MMELSKLFKPLLPILILAGGIIAGGGGRWGIARLKWEFWAADRQQSLLARPMSAEISPAAEPTITLEGIVVYPANGSRLAEVPERVFMNFPQEISGEINVAINRGNQPFKTPDPPEFQDAKRTISMKLPPDLGDGDYTVLYQACFDEDNKTCIRGNYKFLVAKGQ